MKHEAFQEVGLLRKNQADELKSVISAQSFAKQLKKFMIDKSLVLL